MTTSQIVSDKILETAIRNIADTPDFPKKISWWLQQANSVERWLQFELAYQLDVCLRQTHFVLCEHKWKDMVVIARPPTSQPLAQNTVVTAMELKMFGNWHVTEHERRILNQDKEKIDGYYASEKKTPGIAIVIWVIVRPKGSSENHQWLIEQVGTVGIGVANFDGIDEEMKKNHQDFKMACRLTIDPPQEFEALEIAAYTYRKDPTS